MINNDFYSVEIPKHVSDNKDTIPYKITANLNSGDQLNFLIKQFPSTESLNIYDDNYSVLALYDNITQLKRLEHLQKLSIKPISFFGDEHCEFLVESCPNLKALKIVKSGITSNSFKSLVKLKNLEKLNLSENTDLKDCSVLVEKSLTFPKIKELDFFGTDFELDGESLICGLKSFPNLEKLIFSYKKWESEDEVDCTENLNWVSEDFNESALDLIPYLPNLSSLEILNHYFLDLRSVVRVENLRNLTSLCIPSTIIQHGSLRYLSTNEIVRQSYKDLNKFTKLEELLLNFASDRYEFSTPSCQYLKELKNHPSLKSFTAYFGSFNFREMERILHVAEGVNKITFIASEFIYEDYEPIMNPNIISLEISNNDLDSIQDEYYFQRIFDDYLCSKKLDISYDPFKKMNMAEEILIRKSFDELQLSAPHAMFGYKLYKDEGEDLNDDFMNFADYLKISGFSTAGFIRPKGISQIVDETKMKIMNEFRRIGTTINFFPFSKFAPRLMELILSCPEEFLEKEAFIEISKLPDLETLVLGAGTDSEKIYEGIEEISSLVVSKCGDGIFNPISTFKIKKAGSDLNQNEDILGQVGLKRLFSGSTPKPKRIFEKL